MTTAYVYDDAEFELALEEMEDELESALETYAPFNTAHEGYAVLLEEVDELWAHVRMKQGKRDVSGMRREAIQVAAMAIRFAIDLCGEKGQN